MARNDDDEDERPKKKRKSEQTELSGWQKYKRSPIRFLILGLLLIAMAVMAYMLYMKKQRENAQNKNAIVWPAISIRI